GSKIRISRLLRSYSNPVLLDCILQALCILQGLECDSRPLSMEENIACRIQSNKKPGGILPGLDSPQENCRSTERRMSASGHRSHPRLHLFHPSLCWRMDWKTGAGNRLRLRRCNC